MSFLDVVKVSFTLLWSTEMRGQLKMTYVFIISRTIVAHSHMKNIFCSNAVVLQIKTNNIFTVSPHLLYRYNLLKQIDWLILCIIYSLDTYSNTIWDFFASLLYALLIYIYLTVLSMHPHDSLIKLCLF